MPNNAQPPDVRFDEMKLSVARVGRVVNELYADQPELRQLCFWLHGYCLKVRHIWKRVIVKENIPHDLCLAVWKGDANAGQVKDFVRLVKPFREKCGAPNKGTFVKTSFIEIIWEQLDVAKYHSEREDPYLLIIIGGAGCGKSTGFYNWAVTNNHGTSCYHRARNSAGKKTLLAGIAKANGADESQNSARVESVVYDCFWPGRVLLIDEAHGILSKNPKQYALEAVRGIADERRCAAALAFTDDNLERDLAKSGYIFNQLAWRGRFIRLPRAGTKKDIRNLFSFRCPDLDLTPKLELVFEEINEHRMGGFGGVANVIGDALLAAERRDVDLTETIILTSAKMQYGLGDAKTGEQPGAKEKTLRVIDQYRRRGT